MAQDIKNGKKINGFKDGNDVPINFVEHAEVFTEKNIQFNLSVV